MKNIYILETTPRSYKGKLHGAILGGVLGAGITGLLNSSKLGDDNIFNISPSLLKGASLGSLIGKNIGNIDDIFNSKELFDQCNDDDDDNKYDKILNEIKNNNNNKL